MNKLVYFFSTAMTAHVFFQEHFSHLKKQKNEIIVVAGKDSFFSFLDEFCKKNEIKLISFKARRGYGLNCFMEYLRVVRIAKNLSKKRYTFITNTPKISLYIALFTLFRKKNRIVHYNHGLASYPADSLLKKIILIIEAFICSQCKAVIFVSSSMRDWATDNFPNTFKYPRFYFLNSIRGVKIPGKRDIDNNKPNKIKLGYIGRISKAKGFKEFFDIVIRLNAEGYDIECIIAGAIEDENLRPLVEYLDRLWFCDYLGHVEHVEDFYKNINILVFPSRREGFGMVALESSAFGVPVVAFDIHGVRDAVIDNYTGKLIKTYEVNKMYEQIELLCNNFDEIKKLGERARSNAKNNFDLNDIVTQHIRLINSIITQQKSD